MSPRLAHYRERTWVKPRASYCMYHCRCRLRFVESAPWDMGLLLALAAGLLAGVGLAAGLLAGVLLAAGGLSLLVTLLVALLGALVALLGALATLVGALVALAVAVLAALALSLAVTLLAVALFYLGALGLLLGDRGLGSHGEGEEGHTGNCKNSLHRV